MEAEIEHRDLSNIVVPSTAVPLYDHVPLVSVVEKESVVGVYVCSPGRGARLSPSMTVETGSEVSADTSAPEMLGATANEYDAPAVSPSSARLRTALPTLRTSGAIGARTSVTVKSSSRILLSSWG